jgi:uncharacterized protein YuzB (UPF0349 family)
MRPIIEFCNSNTRHGTYRLVKNFEENDDYDVLEYGCLGNCGQCYAQPFAFVNGNIVSADRIDELEEKILKTIQDAEELYKQFDS